MANIDLQINDEYDEEDTTREVFRSTLSDVQLTHLYIRVCECPGDLFNYYY